MSLFSRAKSYFGQNLIVVELNERYSQLFLSCFLPLGNHSCDHSRMWCRNIISYGSSMANYTILTGVDSYLKLLVPWKLLWIRDFSLWIIQGRSLLHVIYILFIGTQRQLLPGPMCKLILAKYSALSFIVNLGNQFILSFLNFPA